MKKVLDEGRSHLIIRVRRRQKFLLPLPPTALHAGYMDKITPGSEFDPLPGKPLTQRDHEALALRDACRKAGAPVPPVAAPYNGWDRKA